MEKLVIFRDRQELQAADLNNIETYADTAFAHIVMDAITSERMFVGLGVTQHSATEIDVAAGRLWDGVTGKRYAHDASETISLFSYLPVSDERYLNIAVIGQETDTDQEPRDYLTDLTSGTTEPKSVYMTTARQVAILITAGLESTGPQKPDAPTGYLTTAYVLLNPSGIVSIELASNKALMRLYDVYQTVLTQADWISAAAPKLSSLQTDIAALAAKLAKLATASPLLLKVVADVAEIMEREQLATNYKDYEADVYLDKGQSLTSNANFYARVEEGVRFPWAGQTEQQISLSNPLNTDVATYNGLLLPANTKKARLSLSGYVANLSLSQYAYVPQNLRLLTRTIRRTRYSATQCVCSNGASYSDASTASVVEEVFEGTLPAGVSLGNTSGTTTSVDASNPQHIWTRTQNYWVDTWSENYWGVDSTTHTVSGSMVAQTFLNSQNGWLRSVGLTFKTVAADGAVNMYLCNVSDTGLPLLSEAIASATVAAADLKSSGETAFEFASPAYLEPGKRYALVIITAGAHSVALVDGTQYSQGTLFYSTDGQYFDGDLESDIMMSLYYAAFTSARTVVEFAPISLSDGMAAFDILAQTIVPGSGSLTFQYQPTGDSNWYDIADGTADKLLGLPAMCRMRGVFLGSTDAMPGLGLSGSKLRACRPAKTFHHSSTLRSLEAASTDIRVILLLEGWDATKHTCACSLLSGGATIAAASHVDEVVTDKSIRRTFLFAPAAGISSYNIVIDGTTTTALDCYHVAKRIDMAL